MVISLIGFRGSGKSTVGRLLAEQLHLSFVDADAAIEQHAQLSIAEMFRTRGEPYFREQEAAVISALLDQSKLVLATGGGAILNAETRQKMKKAGPVVWLQASTDVLLGRITGDSTTASRRPALTTATDQRTEVETVLRQRWPLYTDAATLVVQTDGRTVAEIVDEIISHLPVPPDTV